MKISQKTIMAMAIAFASCAVALIIILASLFGTGILPLNVVTGAKDTNDVTDIDVSSRNVSIYKIDKCVPVYNENLVITIDHKLVDFLVSKNLGNINIEKLKTAVGITDAEYINNGIILDKNIIITQPLFNYLSNDNLLKEIYLKVEQLYGKDKIIAFVQHDPFTMLTIINQPTTPIIMSKNTQNSKGALVGSNLVLSDNC